MRILLFSVCSICLIVALNSQNQIIFWKPQEERNINDVFKSFSIAMITF